MKRAFFVFALAFVISLPALSFAMGGFFGAPTDLDVTAPQEPASQPHSDSSTGIDYFNTPEGQIYLNSLIQSSWMMQGVGGSGPYSYLGQ